MLSNLDIRDFSLFCYTNVNNNYYILNELQACGVQVQFCRTASGSGFLLNFTGEKQ